MTRLLTGFVWDGTCGGIDAYLVAFARAAAREGAVSYTHLGKVWHLDVGSSHPGAGVGPKGMAVRHSKRYASWVRNVVRQVGPYPPQAQGN